MLSAPTSTAPAASIRSIKVASRVDGFKSRLIFDPARVARPCTSNRFLTANGTPASGPTFCPFAMAVSTARALARARSAVTSVKEFRMRSCLAMRASAASVTAIADSLLSATACAISAADNPSELTAVAVSGCKDTGRLGFVGQREFIDQPRQPQRYLEVGAHCRPPAILDRQGQCFGDGVDIIVERIGTRGRQASLPGFTTTADAESPSAILWCRRSGDRQARVQTGLPRRFAPSASR